MVNSDSIRSEITGDACPWSNSLDLEMRVCWCDLRRCGGNVLANEVRPVWDRWLLFFTRHVVYLFLPVGFFIKPNLCSLSQWCQGRALVQSNQRETFKLEPLFASSFPPNSSIIKTPFRFLWRILKERFRQPSLQKKGSSNTISSIKRAIPPKKSLN